MNAPRACPRSEAGFTIIEVVVASTLFVAFVTGIYSGSAQFFSLLDIQTDRMDVLTEMSVVRTRIIADARSISSAACNGSDVLELTTVGGGPPVTIEYKTDGEHLVRWDSADNKDYYVADHLGSIECDSVGGGSGVTVKLVFGEDPDAVALHVDLLEL